MTDHLFIKACRREPVERAPVWMMRQAGRYLPEYRAIRKNYDFLTMYKTPELAAEVTLQPVDLVGVDAAILFSDILVIPEAMGMELTFVPGKGPVFPSPLKGDASVRELRSINASEDLHFVMDAVRLVRKELNGSVPLIGFSGAPWTLATYMIEGSGSKVFKTAKEWVYARPDLLHVLLAKTTDAVIDYCLAKVAAGAEAIQIFDSWAGILDEDTFEEFALGYVRRIVAAVRETGVPVIYFAKGTMLWLDKVISSGADVISLDWSINPAAAVKIAGNRCALQGNFDPTALYATPKDIRARVRVMLDRFREADGYIGNLGHGILPDVPVDHARAFVQAVKEESAVLYGLQETANR